MIHLHTITDKNPIPDTAPDQLFTTITRTGTGTADQGHSLIPIDTTATVTMIPTEAITRECH